MRRWWPGSGRACTDLLVQLGDLLVNRAAFLHLAGDLVDGVDDGRVVPFAEDPSDGRIAVVRELSGQVHGDLAGGDQWPGATGADDGFNGEPVAGGHGVEDHLGRDPPRFSRFDQMREDLLGLLARDGLVVELGEGADADEGTLELTD